MKVSIIIPALNEEKHLPILLESIERQTFKDYEVIVAISPKTTDATEEVAKRYNVKVVDGGIITVARNNGARNSAGEILYFVDADAEFPDENYLEDCINLFEEKELDISSTLLIPDKESKRNISAFTAIHIWNMLKRISGKLPKPFIESGGSMLIKKNLFEKIGGFREELPNGVPEDLDLSLRAIKNGYRHKVIETKIMMSGRRYDKPLKAIKRLAAIATLGQLAMKTDLYKNEQYIKLYQKLYGDLGGKPGEEK